MHDLKRLGNLLRRAGAIWYDADAEGLAAAVSYYSMFAVAPLLLLSVTISGWLYGKEMIIATLYDWGAVLGPDVLTLLAEAAYNLQSLASQNFIVPTVGILFFSGMVVMMFNAFTVGLHRIWHISHQGVRGWLRKSMFSVIYVLLLQMYLVGLIGFEYITVNAYRTPYMEVVGLLTYEVVFLVATVLIFSAAYALLPLKTLPKGARFSGALMATLLFVISKYLVTLYVATTPFPGLFGAAGLLVVLLIWIYAVTNILYFGAAFARAVHEAAKESL